MALLREKSFCDDTKPVYSMCSRSDGQRIVLFKPRYFDREIIDCRLPAIMPESRRCRRLCLFTAVLGLSIQAPALRAQFGPTGAELQVNTSTADDKCKLWHWGPLR